MRSPVRGSGAGPSPRHRRRRRRASGRVRAVDLIVAPRSRLGSPAAGRCAVTTPASDGSVRGSLSCVDFGDDLRIVPGYVRSELTRRPARRSRRSCGGPSASPARSRAPITLARVPHRAHDRSSAVGGSSSTSVARSDSPRQLASARSHDGRRMRRASRTGLVDVATTRSSVGACRGSSRDGADAFDRAARRARPRLAVDDRGRSWRSGRTRGRPRSASGRRRRRRLHELDIDVARPGIAARAPAIAGTRSRLAAHDALTAPRTAAADLRVPCGRDVVDARPVASMTRRTRRPRARRRPRLRDRCPTVAHAVGAPRLPTGHEQAAAAARSRHGRCSR